MNKKKISINIDKVYTKKGDKGTTSIIGENFVSKSDPRIVCYGEVDELNRNSGCYRIITGANLNPEYIKQVRFGRLEKITVSIHIFVYVH